MLTIARIAEGFLRAIAENKISLIGAIVSATLFPILAIFAVLEAFEVVDSPRLSFLVYGVATWLFVLGHIMVFLGLFVLPNKKGATPFSDAKFKEHFSGPRRFVNLRRLILFVTVITVFNFLVVGVSAYNGFHYSESVDFCARLCHSVMEPEFEAYLNSPHSRVECVECHIGSGASWFVKSKLSGMKQLFAVAFHTFSRPIETPIHGLRPAHDTCEECHRPELVHGDRLRVRHKFLEDEANTHVLTVMLMRVGSAGYHGHDARGSHWHVSKDHRILYTHADRDRTSITEVRLLGGDGSERRFLSPEAKPAEGPAGAGATRLMDCLDCHNRPTHIYLSPEEALDHELLTGQIPTELPFVKKKAMALVTQDYDSQETAVKSIRRQMEAWYRDHYADLVREDPALLERAIVGITEAYTQNVFPEMKIGFGSYERHLGHWHGAGCFRCHDDAHESADGQIIRQDCELCHELLAVDQPLDVPLQAELIPGDPIDGPEV